MKKNQNKPKTLNSIKYSFQDLMKRISVKRQFNDIKSTLDILEIKFSLILNIEIADIVTAVTRDTHRTNQVNEIYFYPNNLVSFTFKLTNTISKKETEGNFTDFEDILEETGLFDDFSDTLDFIYSNADNFRYSLITLTQL